MFDDLMTDEDRQEMAEFIMADEQAQMAQMERFYRAEGRTEQEIAILFFLSDHDHEQIFMAQAECLEHLGNGGKIH